MKLITKKLPADFFQIEGVRVFVPKERYGRILRAIGGPPSNPYCYFISSPAATKSKRYSISLMKARGEIVKVLYTAMKEVEL